MLALSMAKTLIDESLWESDPWAFPIHNDRGRTGESTPQG